MSNRKSMTLETSFFGYKTITGVKYFEIHDLHQIGSSLIEAIFIEQTKDFRVINWAQIRTDIKNAIQKAHYEEKD
jgi:hypothetical protein